MVVADIKNTYIHGKCLSHIRFWKGRLYSNLPGGEPGACEGFLSPFKAEVGDEHPWHSGSWKVSMKLVVIGKKQLKISDVCVLGCMLSN